MSTMTNWSYNNGCIAYFLLCMRENGHISTSGLQSDLSIVFLAPLHVRRENFGDSRTFKADILYLIFAWVFRTSWLKMEVLGGKIGEGVVQYWPPTNLFLLFGVFTSVPILVKIDKEMRLWECSQTDRQTDRQTQTDSIVCPMLYAIAMGQIINKQRGKT